MTEVATMNCGYQVGKHSRTRERPHLSTMKIRIFLFTGKISKINKSIRNYINISLIINLIGTKKILQQGVAGSDIR